MVKTRASSLAAASRIATGNYTGDGAATQAVIGVGFQPIAVIIYKNLDGGKTPGFKVLEDGLFTYFWYDIVQDYYYMNDMIISLDADGFTVGDGTGDVNTFNVNAQVYTYICFG